MEITVEAPKTQTKTYKEYIDPAKIMAVFTFGDEKEKTPIHQNLLLKYATNIEISNFESTFTPLDTLNITFKIPASEYKEVENKFKIAPGTKAFFSFWWLDASEIFKYSSYFFLSNYASFSYSSGWYYEITVSFTSIKYNTEKVENAPIEKISDLIEHNTRMIAKVNKINIIVPKNLVSSIETFLQKPVKDLKDEGPGTLILTPNDRAIYKQTMEKIFSEHKLKLCLIKMPNENELTLYFIQRDENKAPEGEPKYILQGNTYEIDIPRKIIPISNFSLSDDLPSQWFIFQQASPNVFGFVEVETILLPDIDILDLVEIQAPLFEGVIGTVANYRHSIYPGARTTLKLMVNFKKKETQLIRQPSSK